MELRPYILIMAIVVMIASCDHAVNVNGGYSKVVELFDSITAQNWVNIFKYIVLCGIIYFFVWSLIKDTNGTFRDGK